MEKKRDDRPGLNEWNIRKDERANLLLIRTGLKRLAKHAKGVTQFSIHGEN